MYGIVDTLRSEASAVATNGRVLEDFVFIDCSIFLRGEDTQRPPVAESVRWLAYFHLHANVLQHLYQRREAIQ